MEKINSYVKSLILFGKLTLNNNYYLKNYSSERIYINMVEPPLISVIIPVYNVEAYLEACIKSVLKQSYDNLEIILVNDGSTDKSGMLCDYWEKQDSRIEVIHKKNGGLSDARNTGISHSHGAYLSFVDSDDFINENMLMYLFQLLKKYNSAISICDAVHIYPKQKVKYQSETREYIYTSEQAICKLLYQTAFLPSAWGKLYKRELFDQIWFPVGMIFEDIAIMYKLFDRAHLISYGNAKFYAYMHRKNSITTQKFSPRDLDILRICEEQMAFSLDKSNEIKKAVQAYACVAALRVYLNAVPEKQYLKERIHCQKIINTLGTEVFHDLNCRKKLKFALFLYHNFRFSIKLFYKCVNRWK